MKEKVMRWKRIKTMTEVQKIYHNNAFWENYRVFKYYNDLEFEQNICTYNWTLKYNQAMYLQFLFQIFWRLSYHIHPCIQKPLINLNTFSDDCNCIIQCFIQYYQYMRLEGIEINCSLCLCNLYAFVIYFIMES